MARRFLGLALVLFVLAGCGGGKYSEESYSNPKFDPLARNAEQGSIFGQNALDLFGSKKPGGDAGVGIGVNSFLWRASLDTLAFMPLASADPFGGVIITDWYSPPDTPNERFKVNLFILDRQLRSDGLRAAVFHQTRDANGGWVDAKVAPNTETDLENAILTRARQLRINTTASAQ